MRLSDSASDAPVSWTRVVLLFLCLAVCGVAQWYIFQKIEWAYASGVLVSAAILAAFLLGKPQPLATAVPPYSADTAGHGRPLLAVSITAAGTFAIIAGVHLLTTQWELRFEMGWLCVVAGVAVGSFGLSRFDGVYRKNVAPVRWERREIAVFTAILLLGLFLRFYRYGEFPPPDGVCAVEEPQSGQGCYLAMGGYRWWEFMLDRWLPMPFWKVFGVSLTTLRLPFTIVSWLTIVPLYLLLRQLVSRPAALFATGLFAICRWHLIYARLAHAVFGPTLPLILTAMYLCVRVQRHGGLAAYPWIGLLSAATLFGYAGYRGTTLFIGLFLFVSLLWHWRAARRAPSEAERGAAWTALRVEIIGIALVALGFLAVAVPLYSRLAMNPTFFVEALVRATEDPGYYSDDSALVWKTRVRRIRQTAMMFMHHGDGSPAFNLPGAPQLDPVSGTLFVIGLAYCVAFACFRFQGFFAVNFLVLLLMGTVFVHNFDIRRLQGIIPLIFVLIAFAADRFAHLAVARFGLGVRPALAGAALFLGGLALYDNYDVYFRRMINNSTVRASFQNHYTVAYSYLLQLPENAYLIATTDMINLFMPSDYEWLWRTGPPAHSSNDWLPLFRGDDGPWRGRDLHLLIQQPQYEVKQLLALIAERFPGARCDSYAHPARVYPDYWVCDLPQPLGGEPLAGGVTARYFRGDAPEPFLVRQEPVISYAFFPDECLVYKGQHQPPCRAEWEGRWRVEEPGNYQLLVQTRRARMGLTVDGQILRRPPEPGGQWLGDDQVQRGVELSAGEHLVQIKAIFSSLEFGGARVQVRRHGTHEWELLRFAKG